MNTPSINDFLQHYFLPALFTIGCICFVLAIIIASVPALRKIAENYLCN